MKFINILFVWILLSSCGTNLLERPEYKLIKKFSSRVKKQRGIVLWSYGLNHSLWREKYTENRIADFDLLYALKKTRGDVMSLNEARCLIMSISQSLLNDINENIQIRNDLDVYPFTTDRIDVSLVFIDQNNIGLGGGSIESVYLSKNRVKYKKYDIQEYNPPIAFGTHYVVHEESYAEALEIAKQQGCLQHF